jgi:P2-related tail formation protein
MTLNEFVTLMYAEIRLFRDWWTEQHKANPDGFPLEIHEDNEGLWWEFFNEYSNRHDR